MYMKVINGNRKALEQEVLSLLMRETDETIMDAALDKLRPAGQLRLVTSQEPEIPPLSQKSLHRPIEDKI